MSRRWLPPAGRHARNGSPCGPVALSRGATVGAAQRPESRRSPARGNGFSRALHQRRVHGRWGPCLGRPAPLARSCPVANARPHHAHRGGPPQPHVRARGVLAWYPGLLTGSSALGMARGRAANREGRRGHLICVIMASPFPQVGAHSPVDPHLGLSQVARRWGSGDGTFCTRPRQCRRVGCSASGATSTRDQRPRCREQGRSSMSSKKAVAEVPRPWARWQRRLAGARLAGPWRITVWPCQAVVTSGESLLVQEGRHGPAGNLGRAGRHGGRVRCDALPGEAVKALATALAWLGVLGALLGFGRAYQDYDASQSEARSWVGIPAVVADSRSPGRRVAGLPVLHVRGPAPGRRATPLSSPTWATTPGTRTPTPAGV